jgi:hypothetical protein
MIASQSQLNFAPKGSATIDALRTCSIRGGFNATINTDRPRTTMKSTFGNRTKSLATIRDIKPQLLESKVSEKQDFFRLSDGFKKIFGGSKKEPTKMVIPISGYGGHMRGERSQNYFGKSYRDTAIQSTKLSR